MTPVVIVILAVVWAAVLIPPMLQNRSQARPADSISAFQSQLSTLQRRTTGGSASGPITPPNGMRAVRPVTSTPGVAGPAEFRAVPLGTVDQARLARIDAQRRRRRVLAGLLIAAAATLALSFVLPPLRTLHLVIDALLVSYVVLLVRRRKLALERAAKVRYMDQAPARRRAPSAQPARRPVAERQPVPAGRHARAQRPERAAGPAQLELRPAASG